MDRRPGSSRLTSSSALTVEEVAGRKEMARFVELPQALYGHDPRWAPPVMAWERFRLDPHRNSYFERGDGVYLLARKLGRPAGRIAAHLPAPGGEGRFGFFTCIDDIDVARVLVDSARAWLVEQGCPSMTGPFSFEPDDEPGLLADGFEVAGSTGRPWCPRSESRMLHELGFEIVAEQPWWRLPTFASVDDPATPSTPSEAMPGQAGPYADPRLVLPGIAAVPDVADALRHSSLRSAWALAKRARAGDWDTCTVVRCSVDAGVAVPELQMAAGRARYSEVVAPWSPETLAPPAAVHHIVRLTW